MPTTKPQPDEQAEQDQDLEALDAEESQEEELDDQADAMEALAEDYKEKWQRALAELENFRKRAEQEKQAVKQFGLQGFIEDLLPVVDNFYRATEHVPEDQKDSPWIVGIQYIQKNLLDVLEQKGVVEIPTKIGDPFDAHKHEALSSSESAEYPEDSIIGVTNRGYLLNGRVLRPVQVTVSKKSN